MPCPFEWVGSIESYNVQIGCVWGLELAESDRCTPGKGFYAKFIVMLGFPRLILNIPPTPDVEMFPTVAKIWRGTT